MTVLCGGGPSEPRTGQQEFVIIAADRLVNFIQTGGMTWLLDWVPGAGALSFHLPTFCGTDPPAIPTIDAARVASWVLPPDGAVKLRQDMANLVGHFFWFTACQCTTGPQPPAPPPVPQPTGYDLNPPSVAPPITTPPCGPTQGAWFEGISFDASGNYERPAPLNWTIPPGATWLNVDLCSANASGSSFPITWTYVQVAQSGPTISTSFTQDLPSTSLPCPQWSFVIQPDTVAIEVRAHTDNTAHGQVSVQHTPTFYCQGQPNVPTQPCCPPDPTLQQLLFQIYGTVQQILDDLAGVGRLPYVDSTVHPSLSGTGAVTIAPTAAAIRIDILNRPSNQPVNPGTPDYFFDLGFITPFAVGTPLRGQRLLYDHQIYAYPTYTDQIGYTLPQGVVVNLVELVT